MRKFCLIFCCLILIDYVCTDLVFAENNCEDYISVIDKVAEKYIGKSVPGACVIISEHNKIICSKAYGYADLGMNKYMNTESTVFEWGSISKTFIWVSVMQLVEQGKLDLNADVQTYLPKGFLRNLQYDKPVTILHLMNHTAGFEDQLIDLRYLTGHKEDTLAEVLSDYQPKQVFVPGEISAYSNWGAALVAFIVERVSGQDYKEYVKEHILLPLKMKNTSIGPFWNDVPHLLKQKSNGYSFSGKNFKIEDDMHLKMYPAGTMNGSVSDLLIYAQELAKSYEQISVLFYDSNTKKEMFTETYRSYGSDTGLSHGFWQYAGNSGIFGHEGGTYGFKTQLWVEPKRERVILILTNVMETEFCSEIMEAVTHKNRASISKGKRFLDNEAILVGDYLPARSAWNNIGRIQGRMKMISINAEEDGRLCLTMPFGTKRLYYEHVEENVFICPNASPEERVLAFKVKDGKVYSVSFRLAHDYVPAKTMQGKIGTVAVLMFYIFGGIFLLLYMMVKIFNILRKKDKWFFSGFLFTALGVILEGVGIAGMIHWFSVYSVISYELNTIVIIGWICVIAGIISGLYSCKKRKNNKNIFLFLIFIIQSLSAYYLGFLTMI